LKGAYATAEIREMVFPAAKFNVTRSLRIPDQIGYYLSI
jgi:hypothetical protein